MLDDRHTDAQLDTCKWSDAVTLRSSLQSYNTEIAGHLNELLGTFDFPHQLVATASQKRQSQQLVQEFSQARSPMQTSRRHSVGTCHLFASCILSIGSIQYPVSCTRLHLQSASLVPPSTCSIQSPCRTITCRAAFCWHLLHSGAAHTNREWRWQKGRVEDCRG